MGKIFKILGILVGIVLLLVAAAYVALPMIIGPDEIKQELVKQVRDQTGRDLKIAGDLNLTLFPWLGVKINDVELGNAPGFGNEPAISVKRAAVRVKLKPLLDKQVEIDAVELDGVVLNLIRNKAGRTNLDDLAKSNKDKTTAGTSKAEKPGDAEIKGFSIGGVNITNARVSWDDRQADQKFEISNFNLHSGTIVPGKPVALSMDMLVQSKKPAVNARVGLSGTLELNQTDQQLNVRDLNITLDADGPALPQGKLKAELNSILLLALNGQAFALLDMQLKSGDLNLSGNIKGVHLGSDSPQFSGKLKLAKFNPRTWMSSQGITVPAMSDAKAMSRLAASLDLSTKGSATNINNLTIQLDDTKINGNATMRGQATSFKLNVDTIDMDRYLPTGADKARTTQSGTSKPSSPTGSKKTQLFPLDTLRDLNMTGTINIGRLTFNGMPAKNVHLTLKAKSGVLESTQKVTEFYQGSFDGTVKIDARGQTPALHITKKLASVQLGPLLNHLSADNRLSGQGNINADLTAKGNDIDTIKRTLNGKVDFNILKGAIKGINLAADLRKAKAMLSGKSAPSSKEPLQTDFSQIRGSGVIKNGVLHNNDLDMFIPLFRVANANGVVNLVTEKLNYKADIYLVETSKGQGGYNMAKLEELKRKSVRVPVRCTGSMTAPQCEINWKDALLAQQKERLKSKLEEKLLGDEDRKDGEEESPKDKLKRKLLRRLLR